MPTHANILYNAGTITASGNSGWLELPWGQQFEDQAQVLKSLFLRVVPANLATDETLDIVINMAWDSAGTGEISTVHTFTQITATNVAANVLIPGGESGGMFTVATKNVSVLPPYIKFTHTVAGTTKSMTYVVYALSEW